MSDERKDRLTINDLIEEGGWQKSVAPPRAESRPGGLPKPKPSNDSDQEKSK
jgi:hypothetical protein